MCFAIPYRVIKVTGDKAFLENGKIVQIGKDLKVKKGEYLQIAGNLPVDKLSRREGLKRRILIKKLNSSK